MKNEVKRKEMTVQCDYEAGSVHVFEKKVLQDVIIIPICGSQKKKQQKSSISAKTCFSSKMEMSFTAHVQLWAVAIFSPRWW